MQQLFNAQSLKKVSKKLVQRSPIKDVVSFPCSSSSACCDLLELPLDAKESLKDAGSKAKASAKEKGSRIVDKGKGEWKFIVNVIKSLLTRLASLDVKESIKDSASGMAKSAKDTGSRIADKGHGKLND